MQAIPAIDLIDGKVVRLFQGDFGQQTTYGQDPVEYAKAIAEAGIRQLHLVDLSGAKVGALKHTAVLTSISAATNLEVDFGGGVKTLDDVETIFAAGGKQAVIGSLCARDPQTVVQWISELGVERFVLALDTDGTTIRISGWQEDSGKTLNEVLGAFSQFAGLAILTTDIRRDGTGKGPSVDLYSQLVSEWPQFRWIASGGIENMADLQELRSIGCSACVVGKALLDGKITLAEIKQFNDEGSL